IVVLPLIGLTAYSVTASNLTGIGILGMSRDHELVSFVSPRCGKGGPLARLSQVDARLEKKAIKARAETCFAAGPDRRKSSRLAGFRDFCVGAAQLHREPAKQVAAVCPVAGFTR